MLLDLFSYRPPEEFLFTEDETLQWESELPEDRKTNFKPESYKNLRPYLFNGFDFLLQHKLVKNF